ncbi:MAG: DUF5131 family protein [Planctomycetota bacterium]|nr:DUF5131 family protein [Planctomycetota bacterium]
MTDRIDIAKGRYWDRAWSLVEGCTQASPGCYRCWSAAQAHRYGKGGATDRVGGIDEPPRFVGNVRCREDRLRLPLTVKRPTVWAIWNDLFHEQVPFDFIDKAWDTMWLCRRHTFLVLTKRPARMVEFIRQWAYRRSFGWTDVDRPPLEPGEAVSFDDMKWRNQCGYVGEQDWACDHPASEDRGAKNSCGATVCPISDNIDDRASLAEIGVADEYQYDDEGLAEEATGWNRLHTRPLHAAAANVCLGFSAENQDLFEARMRQFRPLRWATDPDTILFVSLEPLLDPIDFQMKYWPENPETMNWWSPLERHGFNGKEKEKPFLNEVILGAESGPGARPMDPDWGRRVRDRCAAAGVPFFLKSLGPGKRRMLDGRTHDALPWHESPRERPISQEAYDDFFSAEQDGPGHASCWKPPAGAHERRT